MHFVPKAAPIKRKKNQKGRRNSNRIQIGLNENI